MKGVARLARDLFRARQVVPFVHEAPPRLVGLVPYGDSYMNAGITTISGHKPPAGLLMSGRCEIIGNMGVSGDLVVNMLAAARGSSQTFRDTMALNPDLIALNGGLNDVVSWNGSGYDAAKASIIAATKAVVIEFAKAGVAVMYYGIPAIKDNAFSGGAGISAAGGWGANASLKKQMAKEINTEIQNWMKATFTNSRAEFIDTWTPLANPNDGEQAYDDCMLDGTHTSIIGMLMINDSALPALYRMFPRTNLLFPHKGTGRSNSCDPLFLTRNTTYWSGATIGTVTGETVTTGIGEDGWPYAEATFTSATLSSGTWRYELRNFAFVGPSEKYSNVAVNDYLRGSVKFYVDDGNNGAPPATRIMLRHRAFYSPSGSAFADIGDSNGFETLAKMNSRRTTPFKGHAVMPKVQTTNASANLLATTTTNYNGVQILISGTGIGDTVRVRMSLPFMTSSAT